jgi:hypothetical protein
MMTVDKTLNPTPSPHPPPDCLGGGVENFSFPTGVQIKAQRRLRDLARVQHDSTPYRILAFLALFHHARSL